MVARADRENKNPTRCCALQTLAHSHEQLLGADGGALAVAWLREEKVAPAWAHSPERARGRGCTRRRRAAPRRQPGDGERRGGGAGGLEAQPHLMSSSILSDFLDSILSLIFSSTDSCMDGEGIDFS